MRYNETLISFLTKDQWYDLNCEIVFTMSCSHLIASLERIGLVLYLVCNSCYVGRY
jgi:hypothetical protein